MKLSLAIHAALKVGLQSAGSASLGASANAVWGWPEWSVYSTWADRFINWIVYKKNSIRFHIDKMQTLATKMKLVRVLQYVNCKL